MPDNTRLRVAMRLTLANAAAASVALPVAAMAANSVVPADPPSDPPQTTVPATSESPTAPAPMMPALQAVVVTGNRIYIPGLKSTSPVTSISATQIASTGATGTASVNLRDLGPQRPLVLVDGKRLIPGGSGTNVADTDNIPTALVEGVDVLTGGAPSMYGADAVAGVANRRIVLHLPDSVAYFNERMQIARSVGAVPALSTCPIST